LIFFAAAFSEWIFQIVNFLLKNIESLYKVIDESFKQKKCRVMLRDKVAGTRFFISCVWCRQDATLAAVRGRDAVGAAVIRVHSVAR
jgi:hypothetical protein